MKKENNKILIVEDELAMLNILSDKFERESFFVLTATDGEAGLKTALGERPDLVLLDIAMPKMDGMTMLKRLREEGDWGKKVPVILLTNLAADEKIMKGVVEDEPSYYLVKSDHTIEEVAAKVRECLKMN